MGVRNTKKVKSFPHVSCQNGMAPPPHECLHLIKKKKLTLLEPNKWIRLTNNMWLVHSFRTWTQVTKAIGQHTDIFILVLGSWNIQFTLKTLTEKFFPEPFINLSLFLSSFGSLIFVKLLVFSYEYDSFPFWILTTKLLKQGRNSITWIRKW